MRKAAGPADVLDVGWACGSDVGPRGGASKKPGAPSGPRLVAPALGGPTARCLARDGHRSPVDDATDGRHRARVPEEFTHSEPPPSSGVVKGGRSARRLGSIRASGDGSQPV